MGLFSAIAQAFKDAKARADADIVAKEAAEKEREFSEFKTRMQENWDAMQVPWDSRRHFCLSCAKASGELPLDYWVAAHPATIESLAHLSHKDRAKAYQGIVRRAEKLRGSKFERTCDIHAEMESRLLVYNLQDSLAGDTFPSNAPRKQVEGYCIDCAKEQAEVNPEENEFSLPLSLRGQQLIGERALRLCEKHAEESQQRRRDAFLPNQQAKSGHSDDY